MDFAEGIEFLVMVVVCGCMSGRECEVGGDEVLKEARVWGRLIILWTSASLCLMPRQDQEEVYEQKSLVNEGRGG